MKHVAASGGFKRSMQEKERTVVDFLCLTIMLLLIYDLLLLSLCPLCLMTMMPRNACLQHLVAVEFSTPDA
jgi:hypothetical protein